MLWILIIIAFIAEKDVILVDQKIINLFVYNVHLLLFQIMENVSFVIMVAIIVLQIQNQIKKKLFVQVVIIIMFSILRAIIVQVVQVFLNQVMVDAIAVYIMSKLKSMNAYNVNHIIIRMLILIILSNALEMETLLKFIFMVAVQDNIMKNQNDTNVSNARIIIL